MWVAPAFNWVKLVPKVSLNPVAVRSVHTCPSDEKLSVRPMLENSGVFPVLAEPLRNISLPYVHNPTGDAVPDYVHALAADSGQVHAFKRAVPVPLTENPMDFHGASFPSSQGVKCSFGLGPRPVSKPILPFGSTSASEACRSLIATAINGGSSFNNSAFNLASSFLVARCS